MDWGNVATWAGVGLSLIFSSAALVISIKNLKWQRVSAEAAMRSANAVEKAQALAEADREADPFSRDRRVSWVLERPDKNRFVLRNAGSAVATGVTVDRAHIAGIAAELPHGAAVRPGGSVEFMMSGGMGAPMPREIWVSWAGAPEPVALPVPTL